MRLQDKLILHSEGDPVVCFYSEAWNVEWTTVKLAAGLSFASEWFQKDKLCYSMHCCSSPLLPVETGYVSPSPALSMIPWHVPLNLSPRGWILMWILMWFCK